VKRDGNILVSKTQGICQANADECLRFLSKSAQFPYKKEDKSSSQKLTNPKRVMVGPYLLTFLSDSSAFLCSTAFPYGERSDDGTVLS